MDNSRENYFDSFHQTPHGELKNAYYNPFVIKHRKRTSKVQLRVLEKTFETNIRPDAALRKTLGAQLGMTPRAVQVWFQNRRAKIKRLNQIKKGQNISDSTTNNENIDTLRHKPENEILNEEKERNFNKMDCYYDYRDTRYNPNNMFTPVTPDEVQYSYYSDSYPESPLYDRNFTKQYNNNRMNHLNNYLELPNTENLDTAWMDADKNREYPGHHYFGNNMPFDPRNFFN
ncbi:homeobox domain-containing protein [Hamiltosporidium tvaerminnensis]|nr:hypothetical protein LUQ84_001839 [Hamiltosporidium tvaerminnensis]TBU05079.1 homeobox domain-containing protein [Hamiltosporidium tvaerminnensis]TBU08689.1 homeobox domain-containing protein [Hamiltosporidium magnivora]TBU09394.1 homeobox domain-containing protein [Hamiltosporidium magnivora]